MLAFAYQQHFQIVIFVQMGEFHQLIQFFLVEANDFVIEIVIAETIIQCAVVGHFEAFAITAVRGYQTNFAMFDGISVAVITSQEIAAFVVGFEL